MTKIIVEISPSVDGYVAGAGVSVAKPFGDAGLRLHRWIGFEDTEPTAVDAERAAAMFEGVGAVVLGRTMFEVGIGEWGPGGAFGRPCFVVTHRPHEDVVRETTTFSFGTDGVAAAVDRARAAAGDQDVIVVGGAEVVRQCLDLGVVDELRLHVVPVVLGGGTRLFGSSPRLELECVSAESTPYATHLTYKRA